MSVNGIYGIVKDVIFHDAATAAADGFAFAVGGYKTLTVEIYGTVTASSVSFMGKGASGTARALMGLKLDDWSKATSSAGSGELWQFDITGLEYVLMDLTSITAGEGESLTVKGRAVA